MFNPTDEQRNIIDEPGNCVIIAAPGSGKTFVLSQKIRRILGKCLDYEGVIAISYTNKASEELHTRCLRGGLNPKGSYFGTIDRFCFVEIIVPFGKHVFDCSPKEFEVVQQNELPQEIRDEIDLLPALSSYDELDAAHIDILRRLFVKGKVILDLIGIFSNYIFDNSPSCRAYLKARYTHVFIDEYQDSAHEQHLLFSKLVDLGLTGVAVGDLQQAIFRFAKKDSKYLRSLTQDPRFKPPYPLTVNHRCHPSISNYAKKFISAFYEGIKPVYQDTEEIRVFEKRVSGNDQEVCEWLNNAVKSYTQQFGVQEYRNIGILVSTNRLGEFVADNIGLPARFLRTTVLDNEVSLWAAVFKRVMNYIFNAKDTAYDVIETFIDMHSNEKVSRQIIKVLERLKEKVAGVADLSALDNEAFDIEPIIQDFCEAADFFYKGKKDRHAVKALRAVFADQQSLESYLPPNSEEVQVMTFFKSKGLEFDIVFHLDLMEWVLPKGIVSNNQKEFSDLEQCVNVHFVALTRAKEACILMHSTQRTNGNGETKRGNPSEFLTSNLLSDLSQMRIGSV